MYNPNYQRSNPLKRTLYAISLAATFLFSGCYRSPPQTETGTIIDVCDMIGGEIDFNSNHGKMADFDFGNRKVPIYFSKRLTGKSNLKKGDRATVLFRQSSLCGLVVSSEAESVWAAP